MEQVVRKHIAKANNIDTSDKSYILLVDGNSILKSSLVSKDYVNSKGEEYGAVLLFLRRIGQLLMKRDFDRCIVCWDGFNSGSLRWQLYADYKANRDKNYEATSAISNPQSSYDAYIADYVKKVIRYHEKNKKGVKRGETDDENFQRQRDLVQSLLDELFVRQYMYENVEGDDLISYVCNHKKDNEYIVIVSEDRDISQLINDKICLYLPKQKVFVTPKNALEYIGVSPQNIVLRKMICGDVSDNIKGIKGMGEATLEKYYPQIKTENATLEGFLETCKTILEERKATKKKPLKCLENAINKVTDGCQGEMIYEINRKIIDLKKPLLTDEALEELDFLNSSPIDPEGRSTRNVYNIIYKNGMNEILDDNKFGSLFGMYERLKKKEIEFFNKKS